MKKIIASSDYLVELYLVSKINLSGLCCSDSGLVFWICQAGCTKLNPEIEIVFLM